MNTNEWTPAATTSALALALEHGHSWANFAIRLPDGSLDLEATEAAQLEGERDRAMSGLRPSLSHVTTTGRLRWEVSENGTVKIEMRRPLAAISPLAAGLDGHVVVAVAYHSPTARWLPARPEWSGFDEPAERAHAQVDVVEDLCEDRHYTALGACLLALLGRDLPVTRTFERLDPAGVWRRVEYVEIDGVEFWLREPEIDPFTLQDPSVTLEPRH